jgi:hypothetical protein
MAEKDPASSRRDFLRLASVGAAAASVASATGAQAATGMSVDEVAGDGYRETAHVKAYLDSARF